MIQVDFFCSSNIRRISFTLLGCLLAVFSVFTELAVMVEPYLFGPLTERDASVCGLAV